MSVGSFAFSLLSFAVALGVLVFVHELGHFAVAKRIGVLVQRFSIGFGPVVLARRRGETEYAVSAVPLGGYVKMLGEDDEEEARANPARAFSTQPVARLVPAEQRKQTPRRPGTLRGTVKYMAPDFDAPLNDFTEYME